MILALLSPGCKVIKQTSDRQTVDSLRYSEKLTATPATIPMSKALLMIRTDDLRKLPPGAAYVNKSGQATASVQLKNDTLYVSATCDSLQQLVWHYEQELVRIRNDTEHLETQSQPAESPFKWYLYGVLTGILLSIIIKYRKKWLNIF